LLYLDGCVKLDFCLSLVIVIMQSSDSLFSIQNPYRLELSSINRCGNAISLLFLKSTCTWHGSEWSLINCFDCTIFYTLCSLEFVLTWSLKSFASVFGISLINHAEEPITSRILSKVSMKFTVDGVGGSGDGRLTLGYEVRSLQEEFVHGDS